MSGYQITGIIYIHIGMNRYLYREREREGEREREKETDGGIFFPLSFRSWFVVGAVVPELQASSRLASPCVGHRASRLPDVAE